MQIVFLMLALTGCAVLGVPGQDPISVNEDGVLTVRVAGKADIGSTVFLWYDGWIWRAPEKLTKTGENSWSGVFTKRPEDGPGSMEFTQTLAREGDAVRVTYEFRRQGEMDLPNGIWLALHLAYPDYWHRPVAFSHGPSAVTDERFEAPARSCTVNLSDSEALVIACDRATRFSNWIGEDKAVSINVRLMKSDMGETGTGSLTLRLAPPAREGPSWRAQPQEAPLRLDGVSADRQVVGIYEPVEFTLDLRATYRNPFDPDQVAVDAEFTTPSGRTERLPGFYYQGFTAERDDGEEMLSLEGGPAWKVRYAPREEGTYRVAFHARDRSGEVASSPVSFRCVGSPSGGFARISGAEQPGPKYFGLDNGRSLFLIGHNVVGYRGDLDDVFRRMAAGGENYTRFWMCSWSLGLEWGLPVGEYRLQEAWRLDRTLGLARQHGIYLMLCFDTHQDFLDAWPANPYHVSRGGPCTEPMDFFAGKAARSLYRQRLRYIIARYGYHTNLLCWEFANEIEGWNGASENKALVADWHAEMARFIRERDPFEHPVTTSQWTTEGWPELWSAPGIDFVQSHYYANNIWADMAGDVARICRQKRDDYPGKLHLFGEYGISSGAGTRRMDPTGTHLHNGNWAALMSGCASNPVSWWHDEYIAPLDLYRVYRGLADFAAGEPLATRAWRPVEVESMDYARPLERVVYRDLEFRGAQGSWTARMPEGIRFVLRRDGTVENLDQLQDLLHGQGHTDLRSPFVFELDCPRPCQFLVHVGTVSAGGRLVFQVDGRTVRTVELPAGEKLGKASEWQEQWQIWQTTYDEAYGIEVPAGRHTIGLENTGNDWVQVDYFRAEGYTTNERPPLRVLGLAAQDRALLWVQNKAHTWFNVREGRPMPPVEPTRLRLSGFADGTWRVELWDTVAGKVVSTGEAAAKGGTLTIDLPAIPTDLALKLAR